MVHRVQLEGRLTIVRPHAKAVEDVAGIFDMPPPSSLHITPVVDLTERTFHESDGVVLASPEYLKHPLLSGNVTVPVIYYSKTRLPEDESERHILESNLFGTTDTPTLTDVIATAFGAKKRVDDYLKSNPTGLARLQRQDPPRFRNALKIVDDYHASIRALSKLSEAAFRDNITLAWRTLLTNMILYHIAHVKKNNHLISQLDGILATNIVEFIPHLSDLERLNFLAYKGKGETGEEKVWAYADAFKLPKSPPSEFSFARKQWDGLVSKDWLFRIIQQKGGVSAADRADQRAGDAQWFNQPLARELYGFKTPLILTPYHTQGKSQVERAVRKHYSAPVSFTVMEFAPGEDLYEVLGKLNTAYELNMASSVSVDGLRHALVDAPTKACVQWVNASRARDASKLPAQFKPRLSRKFPKPSPAELRQYYVTQLAKVPSSLAACTAVEFDDALTRIWNHGIKILYDLSIRPEDIVRNRDSSLGNFRVEHGDETVDFLLKTFGIPFTTAGVDHQPIINTTKVERSLANIDLQYRWGHVLEDPCQIWTWYEADFLFTPKSPDQPKQPIKDLLRMRDAYVKETGHKHLLQDNLTFFQMLFYRPARKLELFTHYWQDTCAERQNNDIFRDEYDRRQKRFANNMLHYCKTAHDLCEHVADAYEATYAKPKENVMEDVLSRHPRENLSQTEHLLNMLEDTSLAVHQKGVIRTYALEFVLAGVQKQFEQARKEGTEPLIYKTPKKE